MPHQTSKEVLEYYLRIWKAHSEKYVLNKDFCAVTMLRMKQLGKMIKTTRCVYEIAKEMEEAEELAAKHPSPKHGHYGDSLHK